MSKYYTFSWLNQTDNYISRALLHHTHCAFYLAILGYIDISDLSKKEARELILLREQYFIDLIFLEDLNTYNILKEAGSSLGYIHSAETKAAISEALKGENNFNFGKTDEEHPRYGKTHSAETLAKMSKAKTRDSHPMYGKTHSAEAKAKISLTLTKKVFVYSFDSETKVTILYKTFNSSIEAAKYFDISRRNLSRYLDKNKLFLGQWGLTTSLKNKIWSD